MPVPWAGTVELAGASPATWIVRCISASYAALVCCTSVSISPIFGPDSQLGATDTLTGFPGRLTFLQARNTLTTFAKESGGTYSPVTFPAELPGVLNNINALLRNQYSLSYDAGEKPRDGKKYKLEVKVDLNGDGVYEEKQLVVQHRPFFTAPNDKKSKK